MKSAMIFLVVCLVAAAHSRTYPPGVHPAICPDYPFCDNSLMLRYNSNGQPRPEWEWNPLHRTEYPAGVPAAACPNYPFCNVAVSADPLPGYKVREYPAGVPAAACPGYPFC